MEPVLIAALVALAPGASGPAVANLQAALERLGLARDISPDEIAGQKFGPGTVRAVIALFTQLGLGENPTGEITEAAALKLNEALVDKQILAEASGTVVDMQDRPAPGYMVRLDDQNNLDGTEAARATVDAAGRYRAFYDRRFYLRQRPGILHPTDAIVLVARVYDASNALRARSSPTPNPNGRVVIDLRIERQESPETKFRARGRLLDANGAPIVEAEIQLFDRDIGAERQQLGQGRYHTDRDGNFEIPYSLREFEAGDSEPPTADIMFVVLLREQQVEPIAITRLPLDGDLTITAELPVATDDLLLGIPARSDELVRLIATELTVAKQPTEYEDLMEVLSPLLKDRTPADLDEVKYRDISFVAREVSRDYGRVSDLVTAWQFKRDLFRDIDPQIFYAFARVLAIRDVRALVASRTEALVVAYDKAIADAVIRKVADDIAKLISDIREAAAHVVLSTPAAADLGSLSEVMKAVLPDVGQQSALMRQFIDRKRDVPSFWADYKAANPHVDVPQVQFSLQLANLTSNNAPLVVAIREAHPDASSLRVLALKLDAAQIEGLIKSKDLPVPPPREGETGDDARARFAKGIAGAIEASHPTSVVARLAKGWTDQGMGSVSPGAASLLEQLVRKTDYELGSGGLATLIAARTDELLAGVNDAAEAISSVKRIERLYSVSAGPMSLRALVTTKSSIGKPFAGAFDVARFGKAAFLSHFGDQPAEVRAGLGSVHDASTSMMEATGSLLLGLHQAAFEASPPLMGRSVDPQKVPSWAHLFGNTAMCQCEECRSLWGAPAYLVNVFEFLDKRCAPNSHGVTPADVLIGNSAKAIVGRRPDLAHIKLSCENTNTTLPTIDLINEILENQIFYGSTLGPHPNESSAGATSDDLAAQPEHFVQEAYDQLAAAIYPISLPFDRVIATARAYLAQVGSSRSELILQLRTDDDRVSRLTAERLGLLPVDWEILTGENFAGGAAGPGAERLYGFAAGTADWPTTLSVVAEITKRLGIGVAELISLARTQTLSGAWKPAARALRDRLPFGVETLKTLREGGFAAAPVDVQALLDWVQLPLSELKRWSDDTIALQARALFIDPPDERDLAKMRMCHLDGSALSADDWLRLHRFVRLSRRSGIGFADLDIALSAIAPDGAINSTTLNGLGVLMAAREALGYDWPTAATLIADMDAREPDSLYARLFVRSGLARIDAAFLPDADGAVLSAQPPLDLAGHEKIIAAVFGWKPGDVQSLAVARSISKLTMPALSALCREIALSRALALEPGDYLAQTKEGSPFGGPPSLATVTNFIDVIRQAGDTTVRTARAYFSGDLAGATLIRKDFGEVLTSVRTSLAHYATASGADPVEVEAQRRTIAMIAIASALKLTPATIARLVGDRALIHAPGNVPALTPFLSSSPESDAAAQVVLQHVDRTNTLLTVFSLTEVDLERLVGALAILPGNFSAVFAAADGAASLRAQWDGVHRYVQWRDRFRAHPELLDPAIAAVAAPNDAGWASGVAAGAAALSGAQPADAVRMLGTLVADSSVDALKKDPVGTLAMLDDRLALTKKTGTPADTLIALTGDLAGAPAATALDSLIAGVRDRHDPDAWLALAQQLNNPLREARRDALVAYLLQATGLSDRDALFSAVLIDPQISSFLSTSRIANAHAVPQTFVQRIRLGLEMFNEDPQLRILPSQIGPEWDTLADFRFWQANMEVLAFTHWYLDPALRDDITPAFKNLMSFVRQNDPTPDNLTQALSTFVEKLGEIHNLEICGTFLQEDFAADEAFKFTNVLHVVGRSRGGVQRSYYYRRLNRYSASEEWTPWEPMKLDIQAVERDRPGGRSKDDDTKPVAGVHLIPVVWRRRLHVFWPSMVRKVETPNEAPAINVTTGKSNSSPPAPYWEIKLNWSRYEDGAWLPRQLSSDYHETYQTSAYSVPSGGFKSKAGKHKFSQIPDFPAPQKLFLKANLTNPDRLAIDLFEQPEGGRASRRAMFAFDDLRASINVSQPQGGASGDHPEFAGTSRRYMGLSGAGSLTAITSSDKPEGFALLRKGPAYALTPVNQYYGKPLAAPFFMTDPQRSYFVAVEPTTTTISKAVSKPEHSGVGKFDPTNTDVVMKAKQIATSLTTAAPGNTPWVKFQKQQIEVSTGPMLQSLPESALTTTSVASFTENVIDSGFGPASFKGIYDIIDHEYFGIGMQQIEVPSIKTRFTPFFHPFVDQFAVTVRKYGMEALFSEETQSASLVGKEPFKERYDPDPGQVVNADMVETIDFGAGTPFGIYNNELFRDFHIFVSDLLLQGNHFEDAIKALSRILDPLAPVDDPQKAWKFLPFRQDHELSFDALIKKLAAPPDDPDRKALLAQIEQSRLYPFHPYRIARLRPDAIKKQVFIKMVQAWLKWGEYFHRRYDPTSLTKAFQLYLVPSAMMARKPDLLPATAVVPAKSYAELRPRLNELGDVLLTIEENLPALSTTATPSVSGTGHSTLMRAASTGYFCMPPDTKLMELFDLVADRINKLRNGMTLDGVRRQPALFGPKTDPAVLVKAAAGGDDLQSAADAALGADRPHHRFQVYLRIARERVEALANITTALLATLEKKDAEHLQMTRATHESEMLDFVAVVKLQQVNEAEQTIVALDAQRQISMVRWENLRQQLAAEAEILPPTTDAETNTVTVNGRYAPKRGFVMADGATLDIPMIHIDAPNQITVSPISRTLQSGKILIQEQDEVLRSFEAAAANAAESVIEGLAGVISVLPNFEAAVKPMGAGAAVHFGGVQLGAVLNAGARAVRAGATMLGFLSSNAAKQASFIWRERDFAERMNTAAAEMLHVDQLKRGATLHKAQMLQEQANHVQQTIRTKAIETFHANKFTAESLYIRTENRLVDLQKKAWSIVLDAVEQARACYRYDWQVAPPDLPDSLWDSSIRGLYSADPLRLALSQLETSYLQQAKRGPELTRHFSLKDINPFALVALRETGSCEFSLDEALFDLVNPGHYFRRIHSVALTIPSVTGPYTPVSATLRQESNSIRIKPGAAPTAENYPSTGIGDDRFKTVLTPIEQMIVGSTGREDTGMFDSSFNDDRYRPFEGTGAISSWKLSLPKEFPLFDYRSVSNLIMQVRLTAMDAGQPLADAATGALRKEFDEIKVAAGKQGLFRLVSLRHDRPEEWYRFQAAPAPAVLNIERDVLPYQFRSSAKRAAVGAAIVFAKRGVPASLADAVSLNLDGPDMGPWTATIPVPPVGNAIDDAYVFLKFALN